MVLTSPLQKYLLLCFQEDAIRDAKEKQERLRMIEYERHQKEMMDEREDWLRRQEEETGEEEEAEEEEKEEEKKKPDWVDQEKDRVEEKEGEKTKITGKRRTGDVYRAEQRPLGTCRVYVAYRTGQGSLRTKGYMWYTEQSHLIRIQRVCGMWDLLLLVQTGYIWYIELGRDLLE